MEATSLLKLTTALDKCTPEETPGKLNELWRALTTCVPGGSHAVEKVILRWLLKTMNGPSPEAETLRRYPLTWAILGCVFGRIPLFSLAKALADRRFVGILQQTAKDVSTPCASDGTIEASRDASREPKSHGDSLKRKRSPGASLDLDALRYPKGCLRSAESLFAALDTLVSRISPKQVSHSINERAGAEHIKALFRSSAAEAISVLAPLLAVCEIAIENQDIQALEGQSSWIHTASGIWDLHLHKSSDAIEFALNLSRSCCLVLACLLPESGSSRSSSLDRDVVIAWVRDLKRLMTRNFTLPARSQFFNQKSTEILSTPIRLGGLHAATLSPVLFLLVLETPAPIGGTSINKDNKDWLEAVFDTLEAPLRSLDTAARNTVMQRLLSMAVAHDCIPTLSSLLSVCRHYAIGRDAVDWALVAGLAGCDADAFLASEEGRSLLDHIMKRAPHSTITEASDYDSLCSMMLSLTSASVRAREFPKFIKRWFENLLECFAAASAYGEPTTGIFWFDARVSSSVSSFVQIALTTTQLVRLIDDLAQTEGPSAQAARAVVYDAILQGIAAEDFIDAVAPALFEKVWANPVPSDEGEASAAQWRIAARAFSWGLATPSRGLGRRVVKSLKGVLGKRSSASISAMATLDAFRCAAAAWSSIYVGDESTADPDSTMSAFLGKLSTELHRSSLNLEDVLLQLWLDQADAAPFRSLQLNNVSATTYVVWIILWFPTLASMLNASSTTPSTTFVAAVLQSICGIDMANDDTARACHEALATGSVSSFTTIHTKKLASRSLVGPIVDVLSGEGAQKEAAHRLLTKVPSEYLSRGDRERVVSTLFALSLSQVGSNGTTAFIEGSLGVMIQMMRRKPTLCPELSFRGLLALGTTLTPPQSRHGKSRAGTRATDTAFKLFEELAGLALGQMMISPGTREIEYVKDIWPAISEDVSKQGQDGSQLVPMALLSIFVSAMKQPAAPKQFTQKISRVDEATKELNRLATGTITRVFRTAKKSSRVDKIPLLELRVALLASKVHWDPGMGGSVGLLRENIASGYPAIRQADSEVGSLLAWFLGEHLDMPMAETGTSLNVVKDSATEEGDATKIAFLRTVTEQLRQSSDRSAQFITVRRALREIDATSSPEASADLSIAQSAVTQLFVSPNSLADFVDAARTIHFLLDGTKLASTTQWNVEHTLSSVSLLCSQESPGVEAIRSSAHSYEWLCLLTEVILKRHRRRLEGHLHLLVTTLQSLLTCLIRQPYDGGRQSWAIDAAVLGGAGNHVHWERHAKVYSRLLTLVCEPSAASVMRSQQSTLDSATDVAKRLAGQYMYLVVMDFIKLQLECTVPHAVREALLPGVYSVLDVTPLEVRRVMADALDSSGRVIWKDLYEKYRKFGKWRGT